MKNPPFKVTSWPNENHEPSLQSFCEAIAATGAFEIAVADRYRHANLLPEHEIRKQQNKRQWQYLVTTGGMIAILLIQIFLWLAIGNWRIARQCRAIENAIAPIQGLAEDIDAKRQQVGAVTRQFVDRGAILSLFKDLFELTPPAVTLSRLTYEASHAGPGRLRIQGQSDTATAIEYPSVMQKARYLNNIKPDRIGEISRPGKANLAEFQLHCQVEKRETLNTPVKETP
jgi:hypothetical protein